nr:CRISPR-associated endonuclease Cas2 [uncultured Rhodopila sp.]
MARAEMLAVFCYDVAANRARRRVAALLERHAVRVQDSVFEARLTPKAAARLARLAAKELGPADSLRVYLVAHDGRRHCLAFGPLPIGEAQDFYLA